MNTSNKPTLQLSVSCACGDASLTVRGPVQFMLLCACRDCQKATGTGHSSGAGVRREDVVVTGPVKSFARPAASGATFTRHFCPVCGTPLFGTSSRAPALMILPAGLFGDASDWFSPSQLIFTRTHRDWDTLPESLPRYEAYRG